MGEKGANWGLRLKIIAIILGIAGLFMTGIAMDVYRLIFEKDTSVVTVPTTLETLGTVFLLFSPWIFKLSMRLK
jgi:hypothetical protein